VTRLRALAFALALLGSTSLAVVLDASARRADDAEGLASRRALVHGLGFADLALNSGARWLRHPSQVERTAPFADLPAVPDTDPAGASIGPPEEAP